MVVIDNLKNQQMFTFHDTVFINSPERLVICISLAIARAVIPLVLHSLSFFTLRTLNAPGYCLDIWINICNEFIDL